MYGSCVRLYNTVVRSDVLTQMKEDLIEALTSLLFQGRMAKMMLAFTRVCTKEQETNLLDKIEEFRGVLPHQIGLSQYFTLDSQSKIEEIFLKLQTKSTGGDIGGSYNGN